MLRKLINAAVTLAILGGCAAEPIGPEAQPAESGISITAFTAGTPISMLVVEVSAADIPTPLVFNLAVEEGAAVASGTVRVPHGSARLFSLTAWSAAGEITHEGQATIDVRPGQNPPLQITLGPRSGHVPVTVSFGSFSVIVTPGSGLVGTGATVQLSVEVLDHEGLPVGDLSTLQWATNAPAVATVDAAGLVTGVGAGTATIVATYEGVAGQSVITVTADGTDPGGGPIDCDDGNPDTVDVCDADEDGWDVFLDCDDTDKDVHPGATEIIGDGKDNDCDGTVE